MERTTKEVDNFFISTQIYYPKSSPHFQLQNSDIKMNIFRQIVIQIYEGSKCADIDERYQLDATILFIIINNSTCFGQLYAHLQDTKLTPMHKTTHWLLRTSATTRSAENHMQ